MYVAKYVIYLHTGSVTVSASSSTFSNAVVINDVGRDEPILPAKFLEK